MKPSAFGYVAPADLDEALAALEELNEECKVLAGGQSLVPLMNMRLATPQWLVDINRVEALQAWGRSGGALRIGAAVTQAEIEDGADGQLPLLTSALRQTGHRSIRNRGTICGSLAHAHPSAELPAVAVALGAVMRVASARGVRDVAAVDFFSGPLTTVLEPDELLTDVFVPVWPESTGSFAEVGRRHRDVAIAGAAVALGWEGDRIKQAGLALCGVAPTPLMVPEAQTLLAGSRGEPEVISEAAALARDAARPAADHHAGVGYRRAMAAEMTRQALEEAVSSRRDTERTR